MDELGMNIFIQLPQTYQTYLRTTHTRPLNSTAKKKMSIALVTIDGDLTSVEDIVGSIRIYRRDIQCLNNFVMDIIIICPEAVISGRFEFET
jgi:hypothetical protein